MTAHETPWGPVARIVDEVTELRADNAMLRKLVARLSEQRRDSELLYRGARDDAWTAKQERDRLRQAIARHRERVTLGTTVDNELWEVLGD